jgi:hypothetical protein
MEARLATQEPQVDNEGVLLILSTADTQGSTQEKGPLWRRKLLEFSIKLNLIL